MRSCVIGRGVCTFSISRAMALASYTPTQIGRMASPLASLRMTIGMFVTGSIIRPRILTSISMVPLFPLSDWKRSLHVYIHPFAHQTVRPGAGHPHCHVAAQLLLGAGKVYHLVGGRAPRPLVAAGIAALDQHLNLLPHQHLVASQLNLPLASLQDDQTPSLLFFRHLRVKAQRRGAGSRRELEGKSAVVLRLIQQRQRLLEVSFALSRKAYNDV